LAEKNNINSSGANISRELNSDKLDPLSLKTNDIFSFFDDDSLFRDQSGDFKSNIDNDFDCSSKLTLSDELKLDKFSAESINNDLNFTRIDLKSAPDLFKYHSQKTGSAQNASFKPQQNAEKSASNINNHYNINISLTTGDIYGDQLNANKINIEKENVARKGRELIIKIFQQIKSSSLKEIPYKIAHYFI